MHLDSALLAEIAQAEGAGLIKVQKHPDADLWIYNYTPKCQYDGAWNRATRMCRGLILADNGCVIARPFEKFFNWAELEDTVVLKGPIEVTEKMDGSLGILYWLGGLPYLATRGSFSSEQAIEGTKMFREWWHGVERPVIGQDRTYLFEIIYPSNRIVVDYGQTRRIVLLAVINNATGQNLPMPVWSDQVQRFAYQSLEEVLAAPQLPGAVAEGFVVYWPETGLRVKIKHDDYVRLHRIMTHMNAVHIWEHLAVRACNGNPLITRPHHWVKRLSSQIQTQRHEIETTYRTVIDQVDRSQDRRTIVESFHYTGLDIRLLILMFDNKDYQTLIWKMARPDATDVFVSEDALES